jgi:hypothetical protein
LLEHDDPKLTTISFGTKRDFLGFFEDIALMNNSGLINDQVIHYMFGYYAIRCYQSQNFWTEVNKDSPYWKLFSKFAEKMENIEQQTMDTADVSKFKF